MYELKTVLPQFDIKLPTCMYTLKNVSLSTDVTTNGVTDNNNTMIAANASSNIRSTRPTMTSTTATTTTTKTSRSNCECALDLDVLGAQIQNILKSSVDTADVVKRQQKVLQKLEALKGQLDGIRANLAASSGKAGSPQSAKQMNDNGGLREEPLHDIVINGHPNFIPYALLALKNAWRHLYTIDVQTFTHSTMADIGPEAREFEKSLHAVQVDSTKPKINITLIWKNCEHTEMISSPTMYVPIYGEVNIIRYLGRVGPSEYRYENSPQCNEIDAVLDICYQLLRCNTQKTRAPLIKALSMRLQKQQYFAGNEMSIADIGVYTSLKRMPAISDKDLTPTLNEWRKRAQVVTLI